MANKNYLAGKYELTRETTTEDVGRWRETVVEKETIKLDLTAAQAKTLMSGQLYERLGFKSIEYISDNPDYCPQCRTNSHSVFYTKENKWICHGTHRK